MTGRALAAAVVSRRALLAALAGAAAARPRKPPRTLTGFGLAPFSTSPFGL